MLARVFADAPELSPVHDLDDAWAEPRPGARATALRRAGAALSEAFVAGPRIVGARSFDVARWSLPTRLALAGASRGVGRYVTLTHRTVLVQFLQRGALKTLLFDPTDTHAARGTPWFDAGAALIPRLVSRALAPIEVGLAALGLGVDDVDYVAFDDLHGQDLRTLLGTRDGRVLSRFRRAKLLVPRAEWDSLDAPHALQRRWLVPGARDGVDTRRVALTDGDLSLGDGVMLLRTPGHTPGTQTLFINTGDGAWGISANGVSVDSWSPLASRIRGVRGHARRAALDVLPSAATPDHLGDQVTSMGLERAIASRVRAAPAFAQVLASSELTASALSPGLRATLCFGGLSVGVVSRPRRGQTTSPGASGAPAGGDGTRSSATASTQ